jgi:succinoglycan biosynthesis transport protein ExoP
MRQPDSIRQLKTVQQAETENEGTDLWGYLLIIRQRWLLIALTMLVAVGLTAFITLRLTKIYRATTTVRIETQAPQVLGHSVEDVVEMGTGSFWSNIEYYETQYKIIESRDIAARVVQEYKLNEDPEFLDIPPENRNDFKPVSIDKAAEILQGITTVEPVKDSRLVLIHVDNPDPHRAQLYVNAIANAYKDKNLETMLQSTVDAVDWLSKQLDDAQQELSTSEQDIRNYKQKNGILSISLEDRQNILTAQMTAAATKLTEAQTHRIEVQSRKAAIAGVVASEDPMATPLDEINSNALIQQLKQQYGDLSQENDELSERYGPNFPRMMELKAKLKRIKGDIKREVANILKAVDAELAAAKSAETGLEKILAEFREQAMDLAQKELRYNQLDRERKNNEKIYDLLLGRSKEADLSRLLRVNNIHILDRALLPQEPVRPRLKLNLIVSLFVGFLMGFGLALLVEFADRTVKTQDDVEALGIAFLGILPSIDASSANINDYGDHLKNEKERRTKKRKEKSDRKPINFDLFVHDYPKSQVAESCRAIRTNLMFMSADRPAKTILITSPSPQEGKTTVATNLAIAMAQSGSSVLLVDTDMRRPRIHKAFGVRPRNGISTLVLGESTIDDSIVETEIPNLHVLTCGPAPPNPSELMHTESFVRVIHSLTERFDRVIFDSPPIAVVTDAAILSKHVDGTVLILKSLQTTRDAAKHAASVLADIEANILGAVLNDLDLSNRKYGKQYYYHYYKKHGYYYSDGGGDGESNPSREGDDRPVAAT